MITGFQAGVLGMRSLWTPANITTALWFDAADTASITKDGSNIISQWNDKSGNSRHASNSTAEDRPTYSAAALNGLATIAFGGTHALIIGDVLDDVFTAASTSASFQFFIVAKNTTANTSGGLFNKIGDSSFGEDQRQFVYRFVASSVAGRDTLDLITFYDLGGNALTGVMPDGTWSANTYLQSNCAYLGSGAADGGTANNAGRVTHRLSGAAKTSSVWLSLGNFSNIKNGTARLAIGGGVGSSGGLVAGGLSGAIAELLMLAPAADLDTTKKAEGYLAHKWGLTASLPSDHPYRYSAPTV